MPLPESAIPSFEEPLALLGACHDKVRHFAALAPKLDEHLTKQGNDTPAREAAESILRYFDLAAPLHHADEEADLFPALRALGRPELTRSLDELEAEHAELAMLWQEVRRWLEAIRQGGSPARPAGLDAFALRYPAHANREEAEVYGAADDLTTSELERIGANMRRRRGAKS